MIATDFVSKEQWEGTINDRWKEEDLDKYWLTESTSTSTHGPLNQSLITYLYPESSANLSALNSPSIIIVLIFILLFFCIGGSVFFFFICCRKHTSKPYRSYKRHSSNSNSHNLIEMDNSRLLFSADPSTQHPLNPTTTLPSFDSANYTNNNESTLSLVDSIASLSSVLPSLMRSVSIAEPPPDDYEGSSSASSDNPNDCHSTLPINQYTNDISPSPSNTNNQLPLFMPTSFYFLPFPKLPLPFDAIPPPREGSSLATQEKKSV